MRFRVRHITSYQYPARVTHCYNLANVVPRNTPRQTCLDSRISVSPSPATTNRREDYFGNLAYHFEIQRPHKELSITVESEVELQPESHDLDLDFGISYGEAMDYLERASTMEIIGAREYLLDSPMVKMSQAIKDYAKPSFANLSRPLNTCVRELTERIFNDFKYDPGFTHVATPLSDVIEHKRGVCQDFAHLEVACLRSMGVPAKYVSGYIETLPPPGQEKMVGADATHAWIAYFSPEQGWVEFDPTNNTMAGIQHIVTAFGRDYYDVTPLKGVIYGGGSDSSLQVSVDVARL